MLVQSALLIALLFAFDHVLRRKVRAVVRYSLWMLVPAKLLLPSSLSLPTGLGYWLEPPALSRFVLLRAPNRITLSHMPDEVQNTQSDHASGQILTRTVVEPYSPGVRTMA